ncbi:MAG TPA: CHASE3 domain-containing protein [Gemmatimonadaceae bacterium]|nr:CHASE3 domain-containing protein [Gemmatimonadaceae bacterium]
MLRWKWWPVATFMVIACGFVVALFAVAEIGRGRVEVAAMDARRARVQWMRVVDLQLALLNAESAHLGFLLTGEDDYLAPLQTATVRIPVLATQLAATYRGRDERVRAAIRDLKAVADTRLQQLQASVTAYRKHGPLASLALENSPDRHETMATFRELSGITRDYEETVLETSLANLDRELLVVRRLNLATLMAGLVLVALASMAMVRSIRHREATAGDLARQRDALKAHADAQSAELIEMYSHVQNVQEEERARLSRGLHDELGGLLLAARMDVTWMQQDALRDRQQIDERLERVRKALDQGIDLKRRVVEELRPTLLDTMGLVAALRWQLEETCKLANIKSRDRFPDDEPQFKRAAAISLFRILQEALVNIVKHSGASEVVASLHLSDRYVILSVEDNGAGASAEDLGRPKSHGIAAMRHRVRVLGGELDIVSEPGRGTRIQVRVPRANVI